MLVSFQTAHNEHGKSQKVLSDVIGCTTSTFYKWAKGLRRVPVHRRKSVDRAFGCDVDWQAYDREFDAARNHLQPVPAKETATEPPEPAKEAQQGSAGRWGAPSAPKPAPAPDSAPVRAPDAFNALYGDV